MSKDVEMKDMTGKEDQKKDEQKAKEDAEKRLHELQIVFNVLSTNKISIWIKEYNDKVFLTA